MEKLKTISARSSFYGAASYVENDVRSTVEWRAGLTYGYYGSVTYPGDWKIDFEDGTLHFAIRGSFNRRTVKMQGAYPEYYNDVNMDVVVLPLAQIEDLRQLGTAGYKITPHIEFIIEQCKGFRDGAILAEDLGLSPADRARREEERREAAEKAVQKATNLQQPMTVKGPLKLKN
jgi:hypothetical protein